MMNRSIKEHGRVLKVIKIRTLGYEKHIKPDALDRIGDKYKERVDGWFENTRSKTGVNIMNIKNWNEFYKEI